MTKKVLASFLIVALTALVANAAYERTIRVPILSLNKTTKNLIVEYEGKNMLLHYTSKCDEMEEGSDVLINVRSTLNSNGDTIIASSIHRCPIDQAVEVNYSLVLDQVFSDYSGLMSDEEGNQYQVQYDARCSSIPRYWRHSLYIYRSGSTLNEGDKIYLPRNEGSCSFIYVKERLPLVDTEEPEGDVKKPSMVSRVVATPGNRSVFLSWRPAQDDEGIDHYIISYSPYKLKTKYISLQDMPNKIVTESDATDYKITDLQNGELYFFYVLAVDTSGNTGSTWSFLKTATPSSSIATFDPNRELTEINIRKIHDSLLSSLFRWTEIPSFARQTVILEVDGERDFAFTSWNKSYIRILKKSHRRGVPLKLIVRQFDIHGQAFKDEYEFEF